MNIKTVSPREIFNSQTNIDILICSIVFFQLIGETLEISYLIHLKPIPIILLILKSSYIVESNEHLTRGLLFGLIGDVLLMFPQFRLFEIGAVSFLIGHCCYIYSFVRDAKNGTSLFRFQKQFATLMVLSVYLVLVVNSISLWNYLPDKILFLAYGILLSAMTASSFFRFSQKTVLVYFIGTVGPICFLISDYLIAYSKFKGVQTDLKGALIMFLYYLGQYMILKGNSNTKNRIAK